MKVYDETNVFYKIIHGELPCTIIYEDDVAIAFDNLYPKAPIHALVVPRENFSSFEDFMHKASDEYIVRFWGAVYKTVKCMSLEEDGFRLVTNSGINQEIFHFHVHILSGEKLKVY
jgi:diadenosine tetraphosphate (Ap4A) HIT family hydrolase